MRKFAFAAALLAAAPAFAGDHYASLVGKYGFDFVSDREVARRLSASDLAALTEHLSVTGTSELVGGRFLVVSGCVPHACTVAEGMIVADTDTGAVLGFVTDNGRNGVVSTQSDEWTKAVGRMIPDAIRGVLGKWMQSLSQS